MDDETLTANRKFVAEHARYLAIVHGNAERLRVFRLVHDLRRVKWVELGAHGRCPVCIVCAAQPGDTEFCGRCKFLRDQIWPLIGDNGKTAMLDFLTVRTDPEGAVPTPPAGEVRPPEQWE